MSKAKLLLAVIPLYFLLCSIGGILIAEGALHPIRRCITPEGSRQEKNQAKDDDASIRDVSIRAVDGITLQAWYLYPEDMNSSAVILLHGLGDNRLGMSDYADIFLHHGYSVLMVDARAHGESGGSVATYGLLESDDTRRWFEWLAANQHAKCIYGFGESMGAAQLLNSLAIEPHFCAVAAECPFSTFREAAYERVGQHFSTGPWLGRTILRPLVESAFLYARLRYHLDMERVSPEDAVAKTKVPVLLIHGENDDNLPIRHSRLIKARNSNVVLWEVPGTGHSNTIDTHRKDLETLLTAWFASHTNER
jgi:uncharacterized protein